MALNVSLPAELENRVRERVASGMYGSVSEVIREALRLFEAQGTQPVAPKAARRAPSTQPPQRIQALDKPTLQAVRSFKERLLRDYPVHELRVYGSRARGTHRPDSDADVAVILDGDPSAFMPTKLAMSDLAYDVLLETGINISPLPIWRSEWERPEQSAQPALLANIAREGVRV